MAEEVPGQTVGLAAGLAADSAASVFVERRDKVTGMIISLDGGFEKVQMPGRCSADLLHGRCCPCPFMIELI